MLLGLKLSTRKSKAFPYGLYKVQNVVAVAVAMLIFFTAYEIGKEALFTPPKQATVNLWLLGGVLLSAIVPLLFSRFELRAGREANSPALIASAQEHRTHVLTSGLVGAALLGQRIGLPLDRAAALIIVLIIGKTGWELLSGGMRVLLDASLSAEMLTQVHQIIVSEPMVAELKYVTGRNAGRYRFVETEIVLRTRDLEKSHTVATRIEERIRQAVPHVDRVLVHTEPMERTHLRYAVPMADLHGTVSPHFGEAPYFALVTVRLADGLVEQQQIVANPHVTLPKAKGIRVAEWLVEQKVDAVLLREDLQGKGPMYVLGDAGVEMRQTQAQTLTEVLSQA